jgi:DNA-binding transcriptional MerR regulator
MDGYTKKQVAEITGLSPRLVQFYTEQGLIEPSVSKGSGRGTFRRYSEVNLIEFGIIHQLASYGITLHIIKEIFEEGFTRNEPEYDYYISQLWDRWENERLEGHFFVVYSKDGEIVKYYPVKTSKGSIIENDKSANVLDYSLMKNRDAALVLKLNSIFDKIYGLSSGGEININKRLKDAQVKANKARKKIAKSKN